MQTILGAGGAIGNELAKALPQYTDKIRLVSRKPKRINDSDQLFPADLTDPAQVEKAIEGSEIVYVTVGFEYSIKTWKATWPPFIRSVIESCKKHDAKLVFFDNMYMLDPDCMGHMTEESPVRPVSEKGKVRAEIAGMILQEAKGGNLTALIARAADFISSTNSVLMESVYKNLKNGKKADWFVDNTKVHNFTFAPDAGKATALLGNTPDAYNQVWHVPSIKEKLTGKQWVELIAGQLNVEPKARVLPLWMMGLAGIFIPVIREFKEMAYQWNRDYYFDSSKFEKRFMIKPTPAENAIREQIRLMEK
jgi:nucleoside-diphosphate-sugar epimerase